MECKHPTVSLTERDNVSTIENVQNGNKIKQHNIMSICIFAGVYFNFNINNGKGKKGRMFLRILFSCIPVIYH